MAFAIAAAGAPGSAPQAAEPASISTSIASSTSASRAAALHPGIMARSSAITVIRAWRARRAARAILRGSTMSLVSSTSGTPPRTIASASATFWQQTPAAPAAICMRAISAER